MSTEINKTFDELIKNWKENLKRVENARNNLNSLECNLYNSQNELGKLMTPENACEGECFSIWVGSEILQVITPTRNIHHYQISVRPGGKVK